jgi:MFS family permease
MSASGYNFAPEERPTFPGSPYVPVLSSGSRVAYACVGTLVGACALFTNALVNVNAGNLAGSLDLTLAQMSALPALYVALNATGNLTIIRARVRFGIPGLTLALVGAYALAAVFQLVIPCYVTAIATRAACGLMAAGLTTLTVFYFLEVLPPRARPLALIVGISMVQLGTPLARLVPLEVLAANSWQGLSLIELGVASLIAAAILAVPLPPSDRGPAFETLDFATIGLMVPAFVLFCLVLAEGRLLWWTDRAWLGWSLAASVAMVAAAIAIERNRARPLLYTDWIGRGDILRFFFVALLVRLALAEQTYGSVGFLASGGLTSDQLHTLFLYVLLSVILGMVVACVTMSVKSPRYQILAASLIIALGAFLDSHSTSITRPEQLYFSQSLIGFGTTLFIGPSLAYGFLQMLREGPTHLVSLVVVFSTTQNVGGLAGSAILGTAQTLYARAHAASLAEHLIAGDPLVAARIQQHIGAVSSTIADPALRSAEGASLLGHALATEANTLAFDDVFRLVMWASLATAAYLVYQLIVGAPQPSPKLGVAT